MSKTVYKYVFEPAAEHWHIALKRELGTSFKVLHVGLDPAGAASMWIEMTPGMYVEVVDFYIVPTGGGVPDKAEHVGSLVQGPFVWHVYIAKEDQ
jgi:hypothetical protein